MGNSSWKSTLGDWLDKLAERHQQRQQSKTASRFDQRQQDEAAYEPVDRGTHLVPLAKIVGSVGRYHDFDQQFRPKQHMPQDRLASIQKAMSEGKSIPPVKLYQIKDAFYVLDGNHRIAAAKALKRQEINARIVELIPSKNTLENIAYREKLEFNDRNGLSEDIALTEVGQYAILQRQIDQHQQYLQQAGGVVDLAQAADDWYRTIYRPLKAIVAKSGLVASFENRTVDDLSTYISYHQWELGRQRKYGIGVDRLIPKDMEAFRDQMADIKEVQYPEMKRQIIAFVLMNIRAKNEERIMDKLFALDAVQEVHSVHGEIDLIVKIILTRDLLASDSEIIAQFVQNRVRQIQGVISTQTMIPGFSMVKPPPSN